MDFGSFKIPESYLLILSIALVIPAVDSVIRRGIHLPSFDRLRYPGGAQPSGWSAVSDTALAPTTAVPEGPATLGSAQIEPAKVEPTKIEPTKIEPCRLESEGGSRTPSLPMAGLLPLPKPHPRSPGDREPLKKFYSGQN